MSEDRREQLRALRLLGAIVMVAVTSGAGLWIFIRQNLGNAPVEHTASPVTVDTRPRGTIVGAAALPLAKEPERLTKLGLSPETAESSSSGESHPLSTLTEAELQRLNQQKRSTEAMLANIDYTLKTVSFAERAERYCRFSVAQTEALTTPGNISWQQIEERYSELLRSRPTTQEDEVKRQQQLSTLQRFVAAHRRNLSQCQGVFENGWQRLPSDQEFRQKAAELRQQLANAEVEAFTHQGHERQKKGDLDGAIQDFSEAIRLKADDVDAITSRGLARRDKGDLDGAIRDYTEVIRLKPDNEMITLRGLARRDKGDLDGAIRDYTEVIRLTPGYFAAFALRGIARRDKEDLDGAIQDYSEAIRLKPNYAFAFAKRADARRAKGDEVGAQQDYAESLRLGRPAP